MNTYEYPIKYNKILLFDGSYCLHRSLSIPEKFNLRTSKGVGTGGVLGTLMTIQKEMKLFNYYPIVVFDGGLSKRRLEIFPNYKRNLERQTLTECLDNQKTEEQIAYERFMLEYRSQRNLLIQLLPLIGIPTIRIEGWEGDDLLYIISKMSQDSIIVSDDKDIIQLIAGSKLGDNRTCKIRRALNDEMWDEDTLISQNQTIQDFIGCKAIVGDGSDNLASACEGVGPKNAINLLKLIESTQNEGVYYPRNEEELDRLCKQYDIPKRKAYLNLNKDQFMSNYLMTDLKFVDIEITDDIINDINQTILETNIVETADDIQYQQLEGLLAELEINSYKPNNTIERLQDLRYYLDINDKEMVKDVNIKENSNWNGKLFNL